jgi:hypothetical protein
MTLPACLTFHAAGDTRIGKGDVEVAMQFDGLCDNRRNVRFIARVHLYRGGGVADHCGGVMHRCRHIAQNDLRPLGRKADGGCAANA